MPMCFSSARMASLGFRPYFSSIASSLYRSIVLDEDSVGFIMGILTLGLVCLHTVSLPYDYPGRRNY